MKLEIDLKLTRPGKSKDNDRYEGGHEWFNEPLIFYLPQAVSRPGVSSGFRRPTNNIKLTIEVSEN